ncbi:hypothetical protein ACKXF7_03765 [Faecalibacterium sp. 7]|uniref:hypothetical protein n=1 Tax=Faecalibacterium sp. 7 TaxID=3402017 RepID=UPI003C2D4E84
MAVPANYIFLPRHLPLRKDFPRAGTPPFPLHNSPFAQKEKEKFTKKRKTGCVLVQNVVSYKGVQK